ncbi:MAG TPA: hypothetical protein VFI73_13990 [Candidatus Nitrosopolaris sp.]|nr:hypothetical protein [Candidatus Nitrosopolaris sp.]
MFTPDSGSERASSVEDYQNTCSEFIEEISIDYKDWVDRYQLSEKETKSRKETIDFIVRTTNEWIFRYSDSIKKVDIVMNDGINKMAENTAGYPFNFHVSVNAMRRYTMHSLGQVKLNVKATPREARLARIVNYSTDQLLQISSSSPVNFNYSSESLKAVDILDDYFVIDASRCQRLDVISVVVIVEEIDQDFASERRGYSTLILLT